MQHPKYETWPYRKVKPEHVPTLIDRYQAGESARKICLDLPFSEDIAFKVLRDFDIPIKSRKENRFSMGFTINEEAFSDASEPECAYFFGWLLTDGCLTKRKYTHQISMELGLQDIAILESLKSYLRLDNKISKRDRFDSRTGNTYSTCSFYFQYAPITERLIELGLGERKSLNEFCPDVFMYSPNFWRGVVEGDGHLSKLGTATRLQICGSESLCDSWANYCKHIVPEMDVRVYKQEGQKVFHAYAGKLEQCKAVLDSLYLGVPEHMRLKRKYDLYVGRYYDGIDPNRTN